MENDEDSKEYEKTDLLCPQCKGKESRRVPSTFITKTSRKSWRW